LVRSRRWPGIQPSRSGVAAEVLQDRLLQLPPCLPAGDELENYSGVVTTAAGAAESVVP